MTVEVSMFSCLSDNYGFLLHDVQSGLTAAIDTPEVTAINEVLSDKGWDLTHIFNTHHHFDHAGGNAELKEQWGCEIVGAAKDASRIPGLDKGVHDQEKFFLEGKRLRFLVFLVTQVGISLTILPTPVSYSLEIPFFLWGVEGFLKALPLKCGLVYKSLCNFLMRRLSIVHMNIPKRTRTLLSR